MFTVAVNIVLSFALLNVCDMCLYDVSEMKAMEMKFSFENLNFIIIFCSIPQKNKVSIVAEKKEKINKGH